MSDLNEQDGTAASSSFDVAIPPYPSAVLLKKVRVTRSMIEQLGELDRQAQISVMRAVAAFHEIEQELG